MDRKIFRGATHDSDCRMTHLGAEGTHPRERTGVRFVLTNATDPSRADDYSAWSDDYENAIIRPGPDRKRIPLREPRRGWDPNGPPLRGKLRHREPGSASAWPE